MKTPPRIYVNTPLTAGTAVTLPHNALKHLRARRTRNSEPIVLFNGDGHEYVGQLQTLDRREARVIVAEARPVDRESPLRVTLMQAVSKGERMDYTLQKAVELGAARLIPVFTERSVVRLDAERREKRHRHWEAVVAAACEQCGRNILPQVDEPRPLADAWSLIEDELRFVLAPTAQSSLKSLPLADLRAATMLIGPEGGLSEAELVAAADEGFREVSLGPRILRTETAGVAALTALQVLAGDLAE